MSYLKIEDLLKDNEDFIEFDNVKYYLDTSLQSLLKYNDVLEKYHKEKKDTETEKEKKENLEKFGQAILEIIFIEKNSAPELNQKLKKFTPKKQDLIWENIIKTWLSAMSLESQTETQTQKKK